MNLYHICILMCIFIIAFNVGITVINNADVFPTDIEGVQITDPTGGEPAGITNILTGFFTNGLNLFAVAGTLMSLGLTVYYRSLTPVAIGAFASVFWASYYHSFSVFYQMSIPLDILGVFTIIIAFLFLGALIGIAHGSG